MLKKSVVVIPMEIERFSNYLKNLEKGPRTLEIKLDPFGRASLKI